MDQFQFFVRWLHVIAGITWIGHLYFFNFVNVPLQAALDDAGKKAANPKLQPRALWWFRWGAMLTFLTGLLLFALIYMYLPGGAWGPNAIFTDGAGLTDRAKWIVFGASCGIIMWFNVWFIIWPTQRRILRGEMPADLLPAKRKKVSLASRTNTYLSGPMLVGMLGANHFNAGFNLKNVVIWSAIGLATIWIAIFHSYKVGQSA